MFICVMWSWSRFAVFFYNQTSVSHTHHLYDAIDLFVSKKHQKIGFLFLLILILAISKLAIIAIYDKISFISSVSIESISAMCISIYHNMVLGKGEEKKTGDVDNDFNVIDVEYLCW